LQQRILFKGLQQLKVGGRISYSTCSLNPVEDEAVVASALKKFKGYIELVDVELPGFKFRQGLTNWRMMTEKLEKPSTETDFFLEFTKYEDISADYHKRRCLKETMFVNHYDYEILRQLPKCLRVLPHDQNTSGFFITIIKKIKDFDNNVLEELVEAP
jgi:16S rRNA C967 or C1407 C5-methylase (RsmB/RsmF family)